MTSLRLLTLDVATETGWSIWDLDRSESSIITGCFRCAATPKETGMVQRREKRRSLRDQIKPLLKEYRPDVAVIESPIDVIKQYAKKAPKGDMFGGEAGEGGEASTAGVSPQAALLASQLFAVADAYCTAFVKGGVFEVRPQTWQTVTKAYRHAGNTKARSIEACRVLKIQLPKFEWQRHNAADAAMIAVWAKGHLQELKLMQRAAEATRTQSREGVAA